MFGRSSMLARPETKTTEPTGENASWTANLLAEMRERLVHIEQKTDGVLERLDVSRDGARGRAGHPDQAFGSVTYAQFGEDLIILNIFHMLGMSKPSYLDVGAHHPFTISNTALMNVRGSRGINVEANPNLIEAFHRHRHEDITLNVGVGPTRGTLDFHFIDDWSGRNSFSREMAETFVKENPSFAIQKIRPIEVVTLDDIVTEHARGHFPDFLSLDVEGLDFDILQSCAFADSRPTIICVECEGHDRSRLVMLRQTMRSRGFLLYTRTVANLIFVDQAAAGQLDLPT